MKRRDLLRHLEDHGFRSLREGANHTVFLNAATRKCSTVPRHKEISDFTAVKICRDLDIPSPWD